MSFRAVFELSDGSLSCDIERFYLTSNRQKNSKGRPIPHTAVGIMVFIDSSKSKEIGKWMVDPVKGRDGTIKLMDYDNSSTLKKIEFKDSLCVVLVEEYIGDKGTFYSRFYITGGEIKVNNYKPNADNVF